MVYSRVTTSLIDALAIFAVLDAVFVESVRKYFKLQRWGVGTVPDWDGSRVAVTNLKRKERPVGERVEREVTVIEGKGLRNNN